MKVVHLDTECSWRGGERQLVQLAEGLATRGVESVIVAPPGSALARECSARGLACREVKMRGEFDLAAARALRRIVREQSASILHMHTGHAVGLGLLAFPRRGRVRKIIARRVDFPVGRGPARLKYTWGIDRILCVSEAIRQVLLTCGIDPERAVTVHSGIDLSRFDGPHDPARIRREFEIADDQPLLVNVAALVDHKGHRFLLKAMPRVLQLHPGARGLIAGEGPLQGELIALRTSLNLGESVRFLGQRDDVPDLLAAADVFVLSSHLEGLCTSILDAMAMRLPVVATLTGGIPEAVEDNETGFLARPKDPRSLARAIIAMLERPVREREMGEAGRRRVEKYFTIDHTVQRTLEEYRRVGLPTSE